MALSGDVMANRSSPPAILLREAWREQKRIRRRTVANLSKMPPAETTFAAPRSGALGGRGGPGHHLANFLGKRRARCWACM